MFVESKNNRLNSYNEINIIQNPSSCNKIATVKMTRKMTSEELSEIKTWLQDFQITYKHLHRDFSDGVLLANLLKKIYPKLIDLHNYPSRNNTQLKLINWETLNHKVLSKLGLSQNKIMLDKLAKATQGAIESVLLDIITFYNKSKKEKDDKTNQVQEQIWTENDDIIIVNVNKKIGDAIVQVPQKMILYSIYENVMQENQNKDVYVNAIQQKITHLENILKLKTERIDELCHQLGKNNNNGDNDNKQEATKLVHSPSTISSSLGTNPSSVRAHPITQIPQQKFKKI